jgi:WD40 repeat protein
MLAAHRHRVERPVLLLVALATLCFVAGGAVAAEGKRPELILPVGHSEAVWSVALSGDGKRLLTGSEDHTAILWDAGTGKPIQTFKGHTAYVLSVALSGDGRRVLTGSSDRTAILWDAETGEPLRTFKGHTGPVSSAALSRDGKRVLTGSSDKTAVLWDTATGERIHTFKRHADVVSSAVLSRDGKRVLTGSHDYTAILWDAATGEPIRTFKGYAAAVRSVALTGDCRRVLIQFYDETVILSDAATGEPLRAFKGGIPSLGGMALSGDGQRLLTGSWDGTAVLWDADTGERIHTFKGHTASIRSVALSGDGKRVLTGSGDQTATLWDVDIGKPIQTFKGHTQAVRAVALSGDSQRLLTGSWDGTAILWDAATGKRIHTFKGHTGEVFSVALSGDGRRVLTGSWDGTAVLWDAATAQRIQAFKGHNGRVLSVALGPKTAFVVTASHDGTVRLWKPGREEPVFSFLRVGEDWLFWTPEGYYTCSPNGEGLIAWKINDDSPQGYRVVGPEQFRKRFYRPDLFRHLLRELDLTRALAAADKESGRNPTRPSSLAEALPPYVIIARPLKSGEIIKTEECEITAKAKPVGDNYVSSLQLLVDGRPHEGGRAKFIIREPKAGEATATWKANLAPGKRRIRVVAEGVKGSTSQSEEIEIIRDDEREALPKLLLLGVGVSAYEKTDRKGVEYAADDVKKFIKAQVTHGKALYPDGETIALTDGKATTENIRDAFDALIKKARGAKNPVTMIFLAGHGKVNEQDDFYFLAADSDPKRLRATAISGSELKDALTKIPGKVIVFLDACHSGAFAGDAFRNTGLTEDLFRELTSPECGVVMICSSRGKELSQQSATKGGYFTFAVVEGLSGKAARDKNGAVYLPDLFAHVSKRVKELSEDQQHPYSSPLKAVGDLPLTKP